MVFSAFNTQACAIYGEAFVIIDRSLRNLARFVHGALPFRMDEKARVTLYRTVP